MIDFGEALKHFKHSDPILYRLMESALAHDNVPLKAREPEPPELYFQSLAESIVSQQLSVKAADTIWKRFAELAGEVTPEAILKLDHQLLRQAGMSNAKARYILSLADDVLQRRIELNILSNLDNEDVINKLVTLKGIGRWSAEMFLMFTLGRPDVFSAGDLGLVRAVEAHYQKPGITQPELMDLAEVWSPHRTAASLVLWHSRDNLRPLQNA